MDTQKTLHLLNNSDNEYSKFVTTKWYIIDSESNGNYSHENPIKFSIKSIESSLCNYYDAYILVTGNTNVTAGDNNTKVAFKNSAPFKKYRTEINRTFVDDANFINITIPVYNLIEYSDNYSDASGILWQFKRDEQPIDINGVFINITAKNASSLKYKSIVIGNTVADGANRQKENVKIVVPLKYLSNFWRSLEMPLIDYKDKFSLKWYKDYILPTSGTAATFEITDAKRYIPIVTLKAEDNTKLSNLICEGLRRLIYWNEYKVISNKNYDENEYIRERLYASIQGVNRLFNLIFLI